MRAPPVMPAPNPWRAIVEKADVVIIGAGIIGLSSAYWLAKRGAKVLVLDKGRVAWEASGRATGFLSLRGESPMERPLANLAEQLWSIGSSPGMPHRTRRSHQDVTRWSCYRMALAGRLA